MGGLQAAAVRAGYQPATNQCLLNAFSQPVSAKSVQQKFTMNHGESVAKVGPSERACFKPDRVSRRLVPLARFLKLPPSAGALQVRRKSAPTSISHKIGSPTAVL